jgi:ribosome biogenesis GTPase
VNTPTLPGTVIAAFGKRYDVELADKRLIGCVTRGKKSDLACGDRVEIKLTANNEGVVESIFPRASLLYRSNAFRSKFLAANVTQIVIVLAAVPSFYEELLSRCLIAAEAAGIRALIVLNKADLPETAAALQRLEPYRVLGYTIQTLSATQDATPLLQWLRGQRSVLVGQSGMGKSTLVNALLPEVNARTQEVSAVLDSGKHTTTSARLYHLDDESDLIDSPGLQEFGLNHLARDALEQAFIEFQPYLGKCRFNNCRHLKEPDCAILQAVEAGKINPARLGAYHKLMEEFAHADSLY